MVNVSTKRVKKVWAIYSEGDEYSTKIRKLGVGGLQIGSRQHAMD